MVDNEEQTVLQEIALTEKDKPYSSAESGQFSVDGAIEIAGFGLFQWQILLLTGAIWAADAMEIMFISFIIPLLREYWNLKAPYDSMIGVLIFTGMFFGAFGWSWLADRKGRRNVVITINLVVAVFGTISAFSPSYVWMLLFRTITGIGLGGAVVSYTLFAEYCPTDSRGWALVMEQGCFSFGALFSVALAWITLTNIDKEIAWRWYIGLSALPSWLLVLAYRMVPESPRWYSAMGQHKNAEIILRKIFKTNNKEWPEGAVLVGVWNEASPGKMWDLFVPAYRCTSIILLANFFSVTFCYYGICFISERLFNTGNLYSSMFFTTMSEFPGILLALIFLDRIGRKRMMWICWFIFAMLAMLIMLFPPGGTGRVHTVFDVAFVFIARCAVIIVFLVIFVYFSEYYPTVIRSTALGVGSGLGRIAGMITTVVAEDLNIVVAMMIYCFFGFFSFFLTLLLPQDTTGLKMKDEVNRGDVEMSWYHWYRRKSGEEKGDNVVHELHGGIKGQLQQLRAALK